VEEPAPVGVREVECQAALAGRIGPPEEGAFGIADVAGEGSEGARGRAHKRLDRDDVGSEVGEDAPAQEPAMIGEIQDAIRGERQEAQARVSTACLNSSTESRSAFASARLRMKPGTQNPRSTDCVQVAVMPLGVSSNR